MAGREPNFHKKYVVFWAKHLQMGPTKDIWGPLKLSYCLPPPTCRSHPLAGDMGSTCKNTVQWSALHYSTINNFQCNPKSGEQCSEMRKHFSIKLCSAMQIQVGNASFLYICLHISIVSHHIVLVFVFVQVGGQYCICINELQLLRGNNGQ